jgi:hypothetical protein
MKTIDDRIEEQRTLKEDARQQRIKLEQELERVYSVEKDAIAAEIAYKEQKKEIVHKHRELCRKHSFINWFPSDVLQLIFKWVVDLADEGLGGGSHTSAISLSHVNRKWRGVALKTPYMWKRIYANMNKVESCPGSIVDRITMACNVLNRLTTPIPTYIELDNLRGNPGEWGEISGAKLRNLRLIAQLRLVLCSHKAAIQFVENDALFSSTQVKRLDIVFPETQGPWNIRVDMLLSKFGNVETVALEAIPSEAFKENGALAKFEQLQILPTVKQLRLYKGGIPLSLLAKIFPNVSRVYIKNIFLLKGESSTSIIFQELWKLEVRNVHMPWDFLEMPSLQHLTVHQDKYEEGLWTFLTNHKNIQTLKLYIVGGPKCSKPDVRPEVTVEIKNYFATDYYCHMYLADGKLSTHHHIRLK